MKRKASEESLKRSVTRERASNMVFTLGYLKGASQARVTLAPVFFGDTKYPADDIAHCGIFLDPPLSIEQLASATLEVFYAGKNPIGRGRVKIALHPTRGADVLLGRFKYTVFKTHSLRLTSPTSTLVSCIEVTLQNVQLFAMDDTPILDVIQDASHWFAHQFGERFVAQKYYPADPSVMEALGKIYSHALRAGWALRACVSAERPYARSAPLIGHTHTHTHTLTPFFSKLPRRDTITRCASKNALLV